MSEPAPERESGQAEPLVATGGRRSAWAWLFFGSLFALIGIVSFGSGMIAERTIFGGGSFFERAGVIGGLRRDIDPALAEGFPRYAEVRQLLRDEYFFWPSEPDAAATLEADLDRGAQAGVAAVAATPAASMAEYRRQLDYGAVRGLTEGLSDDYTVFLEPLAQGAASEELEGEYEGIGVWVVQPEGKIQIVSPIPGSPAEEAGLRAGDFIEAADGTRLEGLAEGDALRLVRGPAGTSVRLTIRREGVPEPLDVTVERREITIPAVTYERVGDGRVGWVRVSIFGDKTTPQLDEALRRAKADGVEGLILDLRGNGGGWVTSAREMVGRFVPAERGPALYQDESAADDGDLREESILGGGEEVFDLPLVVLVDGGSASASEIVAGALRDYGRAKLVGTPTFGKGLVQRVHDFDDGSSARITFARWLTPNKTPIPDEGLVPDVVVEPPATPSVPAATPAATPGASPVASPVASPAATPLAILPLRPEDDPQLLRAVDLLLGEDSG